MHIGVIPARAGSQRFVGKNRAELNGTMLWEIAVNKSLIVMDRTIINTDDEHIQPENCERYKRPKYLSDGRIDDVLLEMANTLELEDTDYLHLFQPTNPFTEIETIKTGRNFLEHLLYLDSVQSTRKVPNIYHAYSQRIIKDGFIRFAYPEERNKCFNSQLKPNHYVFAGYVACKVGSLREYNSIWGYESIGIPASQIEMVDIDTREDLESAIRLTATKVCRGECACTEGE
ncbi:MAG: hypothetical protein GY861_02920 [bacterium]|nr:hypothetical protein [bacterium]